MYQILIVDDDPLICAGICKAVESRFRMQLAVLYCENGYAASRLIASEAIDIVITDVKMPVWSGIDLLYFIKEQQLNLPVIVLSGFDDYSLVRTALKLGAIDYLLKPVDLQLMYTTIQNILQGLKMNEESAEKPLVNSIHKQMILEHFILGIHQEDPYVKSFLQEYCIDANANFLLLCVESKSIVVYSEKLSVQSFLIARVDEFMVTLQQEQLFVPLYGEINGYWFCIILSLAEKGGDMKMFLPLIKSIEEENMKLTYSHELLPLARMKENVDTCLKSFEQYYFDLSDSTPCRDCELENQVEHLVKKVVEALSRYDSAAAMESLTALLLHVNHGKFPIAQVKKIFSELVYDLLTINNEYIRFISDSKFTDHDIFEQIETAASLSVLQKYLFETFNYYMEHIQYSIDNKDHYLIQKIKQYIYENYNQNIALTDVAAHVFLSSSYCSTLFKQQMGISFRHYLRNVRIEKAKELMRETNMKIYEIAYAVGYNESTHFIRAFKEVTGESPSHYKTWLPQ